MELVEVQLIDFFDLVLTDRRKFSNTEGKGKNVAVRSPTTFFVHWVWDECIFQILCKAMDILYTILQKGKGFQLPLTAFVCRSVNR